MVEEEIPGFWSGFSDLALIFPAIFLIPDTIPGSSQSLTPWSQQISRQINEGKLGAGIVDPIS